MLFFALDRLSREGALSTLTYLKRLSDHGVGYRSLMEPYIDSCGVLGDAIVALLASLARQERLRISERTKAGLARVRREGRTLGRPKVIVDRQRIADMRASGASLSEIADVLGISKSLAFKIVSSARQAA